MKIKDKIKDFIWFWKKPIPPVLSASMFELGDSELGALALDMVGESLNRACGSYQSKVHLLPSCWRSVYVLHRLDAQVTNGGFHQFFTNSCGQFDLYLREDLDYLQDDQLKSIILSAFDAYKKIDYRDQWANIGKSWDYFSAPYKQGRFKAEDDAYYALNPCMTPIIGAQIKKYKNEYN